MTNSVTFDTSGRVAGALFDGLTVWFEFDDLSPFCQGYVEAAFASLSVDLMAEWLDNFDRYRVPGFSDLHPDTLARFMEDCERWLDRYPKTERTHEKGANAWRYRQEQLVERPDFPKLRLYLSPDGKVLAEEVG